MQVKVKPNAYIYFTLLLFLVPLPWLCAWFTAVCVHEFAHYFAVRLCKGQIEQLTIGVGGADMQSSALPDRLRLICIISGPLVGFLPVLFGIWIPRIALCSWFLSVYNLMPLLPLDGGRALQIVFKNDTKFHRAETCFLVLITLCAVYAAIFLHFGILPLCIAGILWLKSRKIPCNAGVCRVQ